MSVQIGYGLRLLRDILKSDEKEKLSIEPEKRHVAPNKMNFEDAKSYCENSGRKLPIPSSAERHTEFKTEIFREGNVFVFRKPCDGLEPIFTVGIKIFPV